MRAAAHAAGAGAARLAAGHALEAIGHLRAVGTVAGYLPIRSEIDPRPAMLALIGLGYRVAVPVVEAPGQPLAFRAWSPGGTTEPGAFGVEVPVAAEPVEPDVLLVPMLAFDARGHRLGYGGGFYDRTIARAPGAARGARARVRLRGAGGGPRARQRDRHAARRCRDRGGGPLAGVSLPGGGFAAKRGR